MKGLNAKARAMPKAQHGLAGVTGAGPDGRAPLHIRQIQPLRGLALRRRLIHRLAQHAGSSVP